MKNILVLTDFSANAKSAEEYGLQLAVKLQVNLVLFNAFPAQDSLTISENVIWPHNKPLSLEYESISNLQARVYELNDELSRISGNIHKPVISHLGEAGALPEKLNAVINKNDIGMVVMGTKGEGFTRTLMLGSNVLKVLNTVDRPVLIVPENATFKVSPNIAYATDLRGIDVATIEWLLQLCKMLSTELSITHVSVDTLSEHENDHFKNVVKKVYQNDFPETHITLFQGNNIKDSLHEIVERMNIDILALLHRKYGFFDKLFHASTSRKMIEATKIPVLIFPDAD